MWDIQESNLSIQVASGGLTLAWIQPETTRGWWSSFKGDDWNFIVSRSQSLEFCLNNTNTFIPARKKNIKFIDIISLILETIEKKIHIEKLVIGMEFHIDQSVLRLSQNDLWRVYFTDCNLVLIFNMTHMIHITNMIMKRYFWAVTIIKLAKIQYAEYYAHVIMGLLLTTKNLCINFDIFWGKIMNTKCVFVFFFFFNDLAQ